MNKFYLIMTLLLLTLITPLWGQSDVPAKITLPEPRTSGGMPLMDALNARHTARDFSNRALDQQMLSDLLWAAFGVNRKESGKRTAPSAMNRQEITLYVSLKEGVFTYNAEENALDLVMSGDFRSQMGKQAFVGEAPVVLTYVADLSKFTNLSKEDKDMYSGSDAAFISQNVYLFCASEGLSTVVLGSIDREQIVKTLKLSKDQRPAWSQCVGYPSE